MKKRYMTDEHFGELLGAIKEMGEYLRKNKMPPSMARRLASAFKSLAKILLSPK